MMYEELVKSLRAQADYYCCHIGINSPPAMMFIEAADAIEELSHVQIAPEKIIQTMWIPVTERLPEIGRKVLVCAYGYEILTARMNRQTENGYPVFQCNGIFLEMAKQGRITHWMPLPQPPDQTFGNDSDNCQKSKEGE